MTTSILIRPGFVVDRTGTPRFISRTAATTWLTSATDGHALQCPDPNCGEVHDNADAAFDCCGHLSAIPVKPSVHDWLLTDIVPVHELTAAIEEI